MTCTTDRVVIGMDPHKRSVTIEVMTADETILDGRRFATDRDGYQALLRCAKRWPERVWAIEGCSGIGRHVAMRLIADGEEVVDLPPMLSARTRMFATGQGRKTDATDAHSVAMVGTRMAGLRPVVDDQQLAVLRVLADRRRSLGEDHTRMVFQLHQLLLELIPGGAKKDLSAAQAKVLLAKGRPRDVAGKARRRVAAELIADLERIYKRKKAYYDRKQATGKTKMEATRSLKRRLSDVVYRRMVDDAVTATATGPGGQRGHDSDSSATGPHPHTGSSDKPLPGPATSQPKTPLRKAG